MIYFSQVGIECTGVNVKEYTCKIATSNVQVNLTPSQTKQIASSDNDAVSEYLTAYWIRENLHLVFENDVAFPNASKHYYTINENIGNRNAVKLLYSELLML